jgi:hypothetical protein
MVSYGVGLDGVNHTELDRQKASVVRGGGQFNCAVGYSGFSGSQNRLAFRASVNVGWLRRIRLNLLSQTPYEGAQIVKLDAVLRFKGRTRQLNVSQREGLILD